MKKISYLLSIFLAIGLIYLLKPIIEDYKLQEKYKFSVNSVNGVLSNETYKGKVLAIFFGYTLCPDVCPTSMSSLAEALSSFDENKVENNFKALFISVDPDRDKLDNLQQYAQYFHKSFDGGTSTNEKIAQIAKRFEAHYEKIKLENSALGYSIAHTSYIYLFDKKGKFIKKVDHFSNPDDLENILKKYL